MTVRQKITLLITAAGFLSSLVFSCVILWEMLEQPFRIIEEELWDTFIGVISGLAFSVLLLLAISYFFAGFILKPIRIINEQARDISEKHLQRRMPVNGSHDEFNELAQTLNQVFDRLQHAFQRQKRLLADASHELKTPLTLMRLALDEQHSAQGEIQPDQREESLRWLTEQVLRMERLVKSLLDLSALEIEGATTEDPIDVVNILESLIVDYRLLIEARNISLEVHLPRHLVVKGNADLLNRAFSNVLDNAIKYNMEEGQVRVIANHTGMEIIVSVENTGAGVSEAEIPKVFQQFYRVEKSRSIQHGGSGLGLAIVKRIVELHGGKVRFESQQKGLTKVTISLPPQRVNIGQNRRRYA